MPWFKIDDSSHSHPKFVRAGNAALGLWVRCGAYSAQHLTEGQVPGDVARYYGTAPQIAKLVKVGLWHAAEHACERCPQPGEPGDYVIHDFFEGGRNTTRAAHEANKQGAKERKAKSVARKKPPRIEDESKTNRDRIEDENDSNRDRKDPLFSGSDAGQGTSSHRTPSEGGAPPQAKPTPPLSTREEGQAGYAGEADPIPTVLRPLANALHHAGLIGLGWDLKGDEAFRVEALVKAKGIPAMVQRALTAASRASQPVGHVRYFLGHAGSGGPWLELPTITAEQGPPILKAVSGGEGLWRNPTDTSSYQNGW